MSGGVLGDQGLTDYEVSIVKRLQISGRSTNENSRKDDALE